MTTERARGPGWSDVVAALRRHRAALVILTLLAGAVTAVYAFVRPQYYAANLLLAPMVPSRTAALGGGLTAALASTFSSGLQPSPAFISRLLTSQSVLAGVALAPAGDGDSLPVGRRLKRRLAADALDEKVVQALRKRVSVNLDRETGIVGVSVQARDSALVRRIAERLVEEVTKSFRIASQEQARGLREAQMVRVDSLGQQLAVAEEDQRRFLEENRGGVAPFTRMAVEAGRLEAQVSLARSLYEQAMMDRESAAAKVLEETVSVVVVDRLPRQLPAVPRRTTLKTALAMFLTFVIAATWILLRTPGLLSSGAAPERDPDEG